MSFQLYNDKVWTFPVKAQTAAGALQAMPTGAAPTAVSSNPASLSAAVGGFSAASLALVLTPKVQASSGLTVTVSNTGMAPLVFVVDIVPDPNLLTVAVDTAAATTAPQVVPVAPGP